MPPDNTPANASAAIHASTDRSVDRPSRRCLSRRSLLKGTGLAAVAATASTLSLGTLAGCASSGGDAPIGSSPSATPANGSSPAIVPRTLPANLVEANPYLAHGEAIIHNDVYSSDVTAKPVPLGICAEVSASEETEADKAIPCFFYDSDGNCITPYSVVTARGTISGGIAIRDVDANPVETLGSFLPYRDDGQGYGIQISYAFVDNNGLVVGATTHGHILMVRTHDEGGSVLPIFEKAVDVDVLSVAKAQLGDDIDPNLLSVIMDYAGNLWFTTGGFHIDPAYAADGFLGYIDRAYLDAAIAASASGATTAGSSSDATEHVHVIRLTEGEGAENGISSHPAGCVVLTNKACYLLAASDAGVNVKWRTSYESSGGKGPGGTELTGAGLAWGSGTTPTLSRDLVLFTDNNDTVSLLALDVNTGEEVARHAILDDLGDGVTVSVENSIVVYAGDPERVCVLVCNWYGAGNAGLFAADADSSVQSYANLYDEGWIENGSEALAPGIERIDVVRADDGSSVMEPVWTRSDLRDTSMFKLSTATGHLYGYTEIDGTWQFIALDWDTGDTVYAYAVSKEAAYNNMAVGMMQGNNGNTLYVPTNNMQLLRLQDRFAYLPERPFARLDIDAMTREACSEDDFRSRSGTSLSPATMLHSAIVTGAAHQTLLALRVNGLAGRAGDLQLFYRTADGSLAEWDEQTWGAWQLCTADGEVLDADAATASERDVYEIRVSVQASEAYNLLATSESGLSSATDSAPTAAAITASPGNSVEARSVRIALMLAK